MQDQTFRKKNTDEQIRAVDSCVSINQLFALVQREGIVIRMKSQQSASSLPKPYPNPLPQRSPLDKLKDQVKAAIYEAERRSAKEDILEAIDKCNTIVQVFQLVQKNNIVIRMKSQQSASCLPMKKVPLKPDKTPLESLKEQVKDAVINGG